MTDSAQWPEPRLRRLWALQRRARLMNHKVLVKGQRIHVIKDGDEQAFDTLSEAERELEKPPDG